MNPAQFTALAELLRVRQGPASEAARMVLVDGATVAAAAQAQGISYQQAWQAVQRAQAGLERVKAAAGVLGDWSPSV